MSDPHKVMSMEAALEEERREVEALIAARNRPRPPSSLGPVRSSLRVSPTPENLEKFRRILRGDDSMKQSDFAIEQLSGFSDNKEGHSRSRTEPLDRTEYAKSEPGKSEDQVITGEIQRFVDKCDDDKDKDLFRKNRHMQDEESPPTEDDFGSLANEPLSFVDTNLGADSPIKSNFAVSGQTSVYFQSDLSDEDVPEGKEMAQTSSASGTELPLTAKESGKPGEDNVYTASEMEMHRMMGQSPQPLKPVDRDDMDTPFKLLYEHSQHRRQSDSEVDPFIDEIMSVQSYTDSIFDNGSVGSSVSSIHSDTQSLVGEYVDFLVCDPVLDKLFLRSMSPTALGPERFRRNFSKILQSYARDLRTQPTSQTDGKAPLYAQGLAFISRRFTTMKTASLIASRYMERVSRARTEDEGTESLNQQAEFENDTSSGDESPENEPNHTLMISEMRLYFREGAPFQRMKRNLRNLIIPSTVLNRVKASTERILDLVLGDEYLRFLLFKALSDPLAPLRDNQLDSKIGIKYFGSRLKAEANSPDHVRLAEFIKTYARYIGTRAVQRMESMDLEEILQDSQVSVSVLCHLWIPDTQPGVFQAPADSGPMSKVQRS